MNHLPRFCAAIATLALVLLTSTSFAQWQLTRADVDDDLVLLKRALDSIHPGKFRFQTQEEYEANFRILERNAQDPMTDWDLYKDIQWFLAQFHDSHTGIDGGPRSMALPTVMPFLFKIRQGKIILTHNLMRGVKMPKGSTLESINGLPVSQMLSTYLGLVPCDGFNSVEAKFREIERPSFFDINTAIWFPLPEGLKLTFTEYGTGETRKVRTWPLTMKQRLRLYEKRFGPHPTPDQAWAFELDSAQSIGYLKTSSYRTWAMKRDFREIYDSVFTVLNSTETKYLIVDLRGNRGGTTMAAVELARWIAPARFRWNAQRILQKKRWPKLRSYIKTHDKKALSLPDSVFIPLPDSMFAFKEEHDLFLRPFEPQPNRYRGKVFLLTDEGNSSAAASLAALAKSNGWATVVGAPTAGLAAGPCAGTIFFLQLPKSELVVKIPVILNLNTVPNPPHGLGTVPHIAVPTTIEDLIHERDPVLEYVRKLIIGRQ